MTGIKPDILWVDVQGAEHSFFQGAKETIKNHVTAIFTEVGIVPYYEGHALKADIDSLLKDELGMVEIESSFQMACPYEGNTIYVNPSKV